MKNLHIIHQTVTGRNVSDERVDSALGYYNTVFRFYKNELKVFERDKPLHDRGNGIKSHDSGIIGMFDTEVPEPELIQAIKEHDKKLKKEKIVDETAGHWELKDLRATKGILNTRCPGTNLYPVVDMLKKQKDQIVITNPVETQRRSIITKTAWNVRHVSEDIIRRAHPLNTVKVPASTIKEMFKKHFPYLKYGYGKDIHPLKDNYYWLVDHREWRSIIDDDTTDQKTWGEDRDDCDDFSEIFKGNMSGIHRLNSKWEALGMAIDKNNKSFYHSFILLAAIKGKEAVPYIYEPQGNEMGRVGKGRIVQIGDLRYTIQRII